MLSQMQELARRIQDWLTEPWNKKTGRPKSCGLYRAMEIACMYIRRNGTQEFLGDLREISQPTVSRIVTTLVPLIKTVLEEFVPNAKDAIEMVKGRVCLVDGTITPCWSYADHTESRSRKKGTTGFNAQLVSLLDGTPVFVSDPLSGNTHDKTALEETSVAEIVSSSGGSIGDKGYQGTDLATPRKKPKAGELSKHDKENNAVVSALRAPIERVVAHFKNWKVLHTTTGALTPPTVKPTTPHADYSSSQSIGNLLNRPQARRLFRTAHSIVAHSVADGTVSSATMGDLGPS